MLNGTVPHIAAPDTAPRRVTTARAIWSAVAIGLAVALL
jgi:uncharacterized membrane protein YhiD involved in acid resistance